MCQEKKRERGLAIIGDCMDTPIQGQHFKKEKKNVCQEKKEKEPFHALRIA